MKCSVLGEPMTEIFCLGFGGRGGGLPSSSSSVTLSSPLTLTSSSLFFNPFSSTSLPSVLKSHLPCKSPALLCKSPPLYCKSPPLQEGTKGPKEPQEPQIQEEQEGPQEPKVS